MIYIYGVSTSRLDRGLRLLNLLGCDCVCVKVLCPVLLSGTGLVFLLRTGGSPGQWYNATRISAMHDWASGHCPEQNLVWFVQKEGQKRARKLSKAQDKFGFQYWCYYYYKTYDWSHCSSKSMLSRYSISRSLENTGTLGGYCVPGSHHSTARVSRILSCFQRYGDTYKRYYNPPKISKKQKICIYRSMTQYIQSRIPMSGIHSASVLCIMGCTPQRWAKT